MTARPGCGDVGMTGPTAEDGMVTAELAVTLPTVVAVLAAAVTVLLAVATQLRCTDAASTAARLAARGEGVATVRSAARAIAGDSASVEVSTGRGTVEVDVRAPARLPLLRSLVSLPTVSARFVEPLEPGVAP
ncbi:MAG TPA: TadE family type IV pilus minor pilin [Mycobacteriales bacterium]|nr:TadE family type IV pilus minor pilin [Mycobacteriales bacterium]